MSEIALTMKMKAALIEYAAARPMIWNRDVACSKKERGEAWAMFSAKYNIPVPEVKKRWEGMRRMYCHELQKVLTHGERSEWQFFSSLDKFLRKPVEFLLRKNAELAGGNAPIQAPQTTPTSCVDSEKSSNETDPLMSPTPATKGKPVQLIEPSVTISRITSTTTILKRRLTDDTSDLKTQKPCPLSKKRLSTACSPSALPSPKSGSEAEPQQPQRTEKATVKQLSKRSSSQINESLTVISSDEVVTNPPHSPANVQPKLNSSELLVEPDKSSLPKVNQTSQHLSSSQVKPEKTMEVGIQTSQLQGIHFHLNQWNQELQKMKTETTESGATKPVYSVTKTRETRKLFLMSFLPDMAQMSLEQRRFFKTKLMNMICSILDTSRT